ncbi:MAG: arylsulfatase [Limisphaerales bacterium]
MKTIPMRFLPMLLTVIAAGAAVAVERPNIVLVLADDLGYGDVSCYNPAAKFKTPHVDRLATQGTRFTDVHTPTSVCTPTRYGILTGRHSWRTKLQRGVLGDYDGPLIAPDRLTLPALLAKHGYRTACVGKWHLGIDWNFAGHDLGLFKFGYGRGAPKEATAAQLAAWQAVFSRPFTGGPVHRGFHSYFGTDVPNIPPYGFIRDDRLTVVPGVMKPAGDVSDVGNRTTTGPAGPMVAGWQFDQIMPALVREAEAVIARGAETRQPFLLYFALTAPHFPVVPSPAFHGKSGVCDLADFIIETDDALGRVMAALERHGLADNTILIFTSDNGPAINSRTPLTGAGHSGSGPLRGKKASIYEGGHRVPFVVRWPGHTPAGAVSDELICQTTFMATCAELLGVGLPENAGEDSCSILPLLRGEKPRKPTHPAVIHNPGARLFAIREDRWKLIAMPDGRDELYDLTADLGETKNVLAAHPEKAAELTRLLQRWITDGRSTPGAPQSNDVPVALRDPTAPVNDRAQAERPSPRSGLRVRAQ